MRVHSENLNAGYTFPVSRKAIVATFGNERLDWISFGRIGNPFRQDRNSNRKLILHGTVVANMVSAPDRTAYLLLYPVGSEFYGEAGRTSFMESVLPHFRAWLDAMSPRPETAGSRHEHIIAEWNGTAHLFHEYSALYTAQ